MFALSLPVRILRQGHLQHAQIVAKFIYLWFPGQEIMYVQTSIPGNMKAVSIMPLTCSVEIESSGYLSLNNFVVGSPNDMNSKVVTFLSAASSTISPIKEFIRGSSLSTVLVNFSIEMESLAIKATAKTSSRFSRSIARDWWLLTKLVVDHRLHYHDENPLHCSDSLIATIHFTRTPHAFLLLELSMNLACN